METQASHEQGSAKELLRRIQREEAPASAAPRDLRGAALAGEDLRGLDLTGADLSGADLSQTDLSGARLFRAKLVGTNLARATLHDAELTGADLTDANLEGASARRIGLGNACLRRTHLFEADLAEATLSLADLTGADLRCSTLTGARLREANLAAADFTSAAMSDIDMALSLVSGTTFNNADMRNARLRLVRDFKKASWIGVDVRDINFAGAYRLRRFISDQNYIKEYRESGRLSAALYHVWWLTSDCGRSMSRWCLLIIIQALAFGWIYAQIGLDYGEHPTPLSPLYFSVITLTTLGYGDVTPSSAAGQAVAMAEVIIGYVMLGGLMSIFSNVIARRAD